MYFVIVEKLGVTASFAAVLGADRKQAGRYEGKGDSETLLDDGGNLFL